MKKLRFLNIQTVAIWSEDYKKLADWYKDIFNIKPVITYTHPKDTGVLFKIGDVNLWIGKHSKVHGKNKDPHRFMINIEVNSVVLGAKHLEKKGVKCIAKPFKSPIAEKYFATFQDPENNIFQLAGKK